MKISLSFNKKNEGKGNSKGKNGSQRDGRNARDKIDNIFSASDNEGTFDFEHNHNRKMYEEKNKEIEREIKEYINEHENPIKALGKEEEESEDKGEKQTDKDKIQYLGYKGEELTKLYEKKLDLRARKNRHMDIDCIIKSYEGKNYDSTIDKKTEEASQRKSDEYHHKVKYTDRKDRNNKMKKMYEELDYKNKNNKSHRKGREETNISIDEIFSKKEIVENKKSKYMDALINSAKRRALEKEVLIQKKLRIDTSKEEKVFITNAYKKKMVDRELIKKDIEEEQKEGRHNSRKSNYNLNLFLKNINAPSNYNRSNRYSFYENSNLGDF
ncbi:hypothetical protein MKS88_003548 [Plasmodium brasilianum]|uniref:Uncharacterized protein n=2 Tax=Plasmodium (Plasmodium) TaxID=418103 RepID=A0A1A8W1C7_PLAMA|nr:conserved Plasmodium protein, unknown function [Plasmodium malariae]KAI4837080.1 hypothetical protein MKS88_003548 [Plasmodium brasilianum]SBS86689.1 conserved Plasmodium protein, unknown function [Plasmodium malariae]SCO92961.1 conserved Plasmodium protein, unknown function [Plasmodium malariae]